MAKINGMAGSTKYLLNGVRRFGRKELSSLQDIDKFYNNYAVILAQTKRVTELKQDEQISNLFTEEKILSEQIQNEILLRTIDVDSEISMLNNKRKNVKGPINKIMYSIKYYVKKFRRSANIEDPYRNMKQKLINIQKNKKSFIEQKSNTINRACNQVTNCYNFITQNNSFRIGAKAEEEVIEYLSHLPDDYYILNDVKLKFYKAIYWKEYNEYIQTSQIDHLVIGPTGIFLIETKNWKFSDLNRKSNKLVYQVKRQNLALWYYLKHHYHSKPPQVWKLVTYMHSTNQIQKLDKFVTLVPPNKLTSYIISGRSNLSIAEVNKLVKLLLPYIK
jgi:hypothetical protein